MSFSVSAWIISDVWETLLRSGNSAYSIRAIIINATANPVAFALNVQVWTFLVIADLQPGQF
jgi:hypothetical protein